MRLTLKPTDQMVDLDGVPTRMWKGETAAGVPVQAYITIVACPVTADMSEFGELRDVDQPHPVLAAVYKDHV